MKSKEIRGHGRACVDSCITCKFFKWLWHINTGPFHHYGVPRYLPT